MLGHMMIANLLGEEMACTEPEALKLATAYVNLRKHYGGVGFDPKTMALITAATVVLTVEAPKVQALLARKKAMREAARVTEEAERLAGGSTVVPLDPTGMGGHRRPGPGTH